MKLLLINLDNDKAKKIATFSLTDSEIEGDFLGAVEDKVADILGTNSTYIFIKDMTESLTPMELFQIDHEFNIDVLGCQYAVILE